MPIAYVFPGQGSQRPEAGAAWRDHDSWSIVEMAEAATSCPLAHLLLDPDVSLSDTRSSQLSVLLASLLAWQALWPQVDHDDVVALAGHSLGQVTALIAAGVTTPEDGLRLAVARADACTATQAAEPGGLVALLGATEEDARTVCRTSPKSAWIANVNGAGQIVLGARRVDLDAVVATAESLGVRRVRRLDVDGAFHTPLMAPAAQRFRIAASATTFGEPRWPIVSNDEGIVVRTADGWPERLTTHLVTPVRWDAVVARLVEMGADHIVEVGPGSTLTGLVRRIAPDVRTSTIGSPADLVAAAS